MQGKQHRGQIGNYWLSRRSGSNQWCRTWFDADARQTRRASLGTADFEQAQLELARWIVENERPKDQRPSEVPLAAVLTRYYQGHAQHIRSAEAARFALKKWSDHFGEATVSEITEDAQRAFVRALRESGCSAGYIGRILNVGKAAVNRAYKRGEIRSVPFIITGSKGRERQRLLTLQESAALFNAAEEDHTLMYLMLAFCTLQRPEAILQLTRFQVDLDHRLIHFNPPGREQTKKRRPSVPISNSLFPWLQNHPYEYMRTKGETVVKRIKTEHPVSWRGKPVKSIRKAFQRTRERAGLDSRVVPYTVRHTMATELRKRGVGAWDVSGLLGHKSEGMTERYAKYAPDYRDTAIRAIDEFFAELQPLVNRQLVFGADVRASCVLVGK